MKIIFLGTSKYSKVYLDALREAGYGVAEGLENAAGADLGIIAYYGKLLSKEVLEIPRLGFITVHYSLLPRWRGPSPIQSAILAGDEKTGVTILKVVPKADAGDIIAQEEMEIKPGETYLEIERRLDEIGPSLLVNSLPLWLDEKIIPQKQDESKVTRAKLFKTEDGNIDWSKTSEEILREIRALNPSPGTFTMLDGKRLLIISAETQESSHDLAPGTIAKENSGFKIATKDGFIIPKLIKLEGKKETAPEAFLNGHQGIIGKILG